MSDVRTRSSSKATSIRRKTLLETDVVVVENSDAINRTMTRAEARPKKRDSLPVLSPLRPFHLARAVLRHHGPRMPPGREKDTSDRFHPATRKATSYERHFSPLLSSFSRLFLLSSPRPALSYRRRFFLAFETGFAVRSLARLLARTMVFCFFFFIFFSPDRATARVPRENAPIVRSIKGR